MDNRLKSNIFARIAALSLAVMFIMTALTPAAGVCAKEAERENTRTAAKKRLLADSRWVFIGDSWFAKRKLPGFKGSIPQKTAELLKLKKYYNFSRGGYGLAREDLNYRELIADRRVRKKITDVFISGSIMNDRNCSHEEITEAISSFIGLVREKYPNAKLWYASLSWYCSEAASGAVYRKRIYTRFPWYASAMEANGVEVVYGMEDALSGMGAEYFTSDHHHPTKLCIDFVAGELSDRIKEMYE